MSNFAFRKKSETGDEIKRLQAFSNFFPGAVFISDAKARIRFANTHFQNYVGYSAESLQNREWFELLHAEDRQPAAESWQQAVASGASSACELRLRHQDGSYRWHQCRGKPLTAAPRLDPDWLVLCIDIHKRKEDERALRCREEAFAKAFACSRIALLITTRHDSRIQQVNQRFLELFGYRHEEIIGQPSESLDFFARAGDRERVARLLQEVGHVRELELRLRRSDGRELDAMLAAEAVDIDGKACLSINIRDISQRKQAERQLFNILESIGDGFIACDANWRLTYINGVSERELGISRDKVLGRTFWDVYPLARGSALEQEYRRAAAGERREFEHHFEPWQRWFHNRCFPREDGGISVYFKDITIRKRAERALQESEEKFRTAFRISPAILALSTLEEGRYLDVNEAFERFMGCSREEVIGRSSREIGLFRDDQQRLALIEKAHGRGYIRDAEIVLCNKRGEARHVLFSAQLIPIESQHYILSSWIDFTERKRAEEALREADKRKDQFLAVLAHELRNPLAPLRTGLDLLERRGLSESDAIKARAMMQRQLNHIVRLVDDLLDLSRISRGKINLREEPVDLNLVVDTAVEICRPMILERHHQLLVRTADTPLQVSGDFERLVQVTSNLLSNAAKYTEPGGTIWISCQIRDRQEALISVRDTGHGIPSSRQAEIFEMFAQLPDQVHAGSKGLGIGLAISRQLVHLHGGQLSVTSEGSGQGSEFVVHLPWSETLGAGAQQALQSPEKSRVLVADDNEDAADGLAMLLSLLGYQVKVVHDGLAAVEGFRQFLPGIVLLDIGMPQLDGYDTARRIRELPGGTQVLLVAITGWGQESDKIRARDAGFDEHLIKPVDASALEKLLEDYRRNRA